MKPYSEIKTVTKKTVDALLAMNTQNRPVKKSVIERYKRDILTGNWMLTNQGIGVSSDGFLIDGQHRLMAIKECGYPAIQILVVYGLLPESQRVVDQQAKRSARDLLMFAFNARVSRSAPAIGNCIIRVMKGTVSYMPTISELMETLNEYMEEIETVTQTPRAPNFYAAPYLAAFAIAAKNGFTDKVIEFMRIVESGEMLTKDMPAYHLRNLVITSKKGSAGSQVQFERFHKTTRALNAYVNNEKMGVLRA